MVPNYPSRSLTNYGLIQAESLKLTLPVSDEQFKYEFFADVPEILPAKSRIVIPYKVTALQAGQSAEANDKPVIRAQITPFARAMSASRASNDINCKTYTNTYYVDYGYVCKNGEWVKDGRKGYYYTITGKSCTGTSSSGSGGFSSIVDGGLGGGSWITPSPVSMAPECTPVCPDGKCIEGSASGKGKSRGRGK